MPCSSHPRLPTHLIQIEGVNQNVNQQRHGVQVESLLENIRRKSLKTLNLENLEERRKARRSDLANLGTESVDIRRGQRDKVEEGLLDSVVRYG
jgi:hypothetical protein